MFGHNRKYVLLMGLILSLLIVSTFQQRGNSRSRSSSSSSSHHSGSHSRGYHHNTYTSNTNSYKNSNCTTINGTTTCTYSNSDSEGGWLFFIIIIVIFGVIGFFSVKAGNKQAQKRKEVIASVMNDYEARMEQYPSIYDINVRQNMINAFMNRKYTMVINIKDQQERFFCQVKVTDLKRINDTKFEIKMTGSDEVGTSKIEGLLIFRGDGFGFKLSKVYDDRIKAEQTGKFDILLYEGGGNPDHVDGQWAFHGFETSTEYSGFWFMQVI